jgi:hypothetical protein
MIKTMKASNALAFIFYSIILLDILLPSFLLGLLDEIFLSVIFGILWQKNKWKR